MGTRLYFAAGDDAGTELWKVHTDGDVEMVADIRPGGDSSSPFGFTAFNRRALFRRQRRHRRRRAVEGAGGPHPRRQRGEGSRSTGRAGGGDRSRSGFRRLHSASPSSTASFISGPTTARPARSCGRCSADGGPVRAADINSGANPSAPGGFTVFNGELYFSADRRRDRQRAVEGRRPTAAWCRRPISTRGE